MARHSNTTWGFYHDRADPRLFVPNRNLKFGWTMNMAHRHRTAALLTIVVLVAIGVAESVGLAPVREPAAKHSPSAVKGYRSATLILDRPVLPKPSVATT